MSAFQAFPFPQRFSTYSSESFIFRRSSGGYVFESMGQQLLDVLKRVVTIFVLLLQIAVVGAITWFLWIVYNDTRLQSRFEREGRSIRVHIDDVSYAQRSWKDFLGNSVYITFHYNQNHYQARYVQDTSYVSRGAYTTLLYLADLDSFRQPDPEPPHPRMHRTSRLVKWTVVNDVTTENKVLGGLIVAASVLFFLSVSLINYLVPVPLLQTIGKGIVVVAWVGLSVFLTYDTVEQYNYWNRLRSGGQPAQVTILSTDKVSKSGGRSRHGRSSFRTYSYRATVRFQRQERVIAISEDDYETARAGDRLNVVYNPALDDLMPAGYSLPMDEYLVPVFVWGMLLVGLWLYTSRSKRRQVSAARA
ncbi:hypothetical protein BN8_03492 [Fibrisoma limi BUZ 3]|uniref:DUF3592 domain-containing protein n=1 Tax=Fibrisoma limi BUZ 3 TaxID=1185876 RepID=I2GKA5_9BACT|nr:DUF3592 domain-containing protein [Fibrisoma limi]CCH54330.1 hypothetical protein BN8_03492 [Fibrisoma limi BUZ 3]